MKIQGMDASLNSYTTVKESKLDTKEDKTISPVSNIPPAEVKNISQMRGIDKEELPISEKMVIEAIEKANRAISGSNRQLKFSVHEKTNEIMVKVINTDTEQVVREFPSEKILDMIAKMWEMAGLIVDERR